MGNRVVFGAGGFIGKNLVKRLVELGHKVIAIDKCREYFDDIELNNVEIKEVQINCEESQINLDNLIEEGDIVYHLLSTNNPSLSNSNIVNDICCNVHITGKILDACVSKKARKVIFISSGGAIYGDVKSLPIDEGHTTEPITSYGVQKLTVEKTIALYKKVYNLDYSIVRLSNPYGPYQRPSGSIGLITNFVCKSLNNETLTIFGDGSIIRDYIYIDDVITALLNLEEPEVEPKVMNIGSGVGLTINQITEKILSISKSRSKIQYVEGRSVDVPANVLDVSAYEERFGKCSKVSINEGIRKTMDFLKQKQLQSMTENTNK